MRIIKHPNTLNQNNPANSSGIISKEELEPIAEIIPNGILQEFNSMQKASNLIDTGSNGQYVSQNVDFQANSKTCKCCGNHYSLPYGFCSLTCAEKLYFGYKKQLIVNYS